MKHLISLSNIMAIALVICATCSCSGPGTCQPDWVIDLNFVNAQAKSLLKSTTPGYFHKRDIRTFTFKNGVKELYTDSLRSTQGRQLFSEGLEDYSVVVAMPEPTMLLQLSDSITDTIRVTQSGACPKLIDKVWYNNSLVYDRAQQLPLKLTITK